MCGPLQRRRLYQQQRHAELVRGLGRGRATTQAVRPAAALGSSPTWALSGIRVRNASRTVPSGREPVHGSSRRRSASLPGETASTAPVSTSPLQISSNGGPFIEIYRFAGPATDASLHALQLRHQRLHLGEYPDALRHSRGGMAANDRCSSTTSSISNRRALHRTPITSTRCPIDNNNGTRNWTAGWIEIGERRRRRPPATCASSPTTAPIGLFVKDDDNSAFSGRSNLTGFTSAVAQLLPPAVSLESAGEFVAVAVSDNGGGAFTEIARFDGGTNDTAYHSLAYDLTPYISANTRIRVPLSRGWNGRHRGSLLRQRPDREARFPRSCVKTNQAAAASPLLDGDPAEPRAPRRRLLPLSGRDDDGGLQRSSSRTRSFRSFPRS